MMQPLFTVGILYGVILTVNCIAGTPTVSIDCGSFGIPGQKTKIVCNISQIHWTGLRWFRPYERTPVVLCNGDNTECSTDGSFTGLYKGYVAAPFVNVLEIISFDAKVDTGEWACRFGQDGAFKSVCQKKALKTSIDCIHPAVAGEATSLACKLSHTFATGLRWYRPRDAVPVVMCNWNNTNCFTTVRVRGKYKGFVAEPLLNTLLIKWFDPNVDAGVWACSFGTEDGDEVKSTCSKHVAATTIDCMRPGIAGRKTELKCTLSHIHPSGLHWIRSRDGVKVVECNHDNTACYTMVSLRDRYKGVIITPLQNALVINSFDPEVDSGEWVCTFVMRQYDANRSACKKTETRPTIDCMHPAVANPRTELKCKLSHSVDTELHWFRPRENISIAICNMKDTECISLWGVPLKYRGIMDAYLHSTLIIESFDPQVDAGKWACGFGHVGSVHSVCIKLEGSKSAEARNDAWGQVASLVAVIFGLVLVLVSTRHITTPVCF